MGRMERGDCITVEGLFLFLLIFGSPHEKDWACIILLFLFSLLMIFFSLETS
ncbi:hypothetical protein QBC38DRAFT_144708 [Podospora fimiseda]|uniref:Uncharacterized protein n=1 Tax=Podospora fimiseda TaxID=252190 RepID=A0AAN7BYQ0_9PEZI|nr:hypothetical protein QBC38DRAFT_144708 [Podospora fimiseda]